MVLKGILLFVIIMGLIISNLNELINFFNTLPEKLKSNLFSSFPMVGVFVFLGLVITAAYFSENPQNLPTRRYVKWLRNISNYPEYQGIIKHVLEAGIVVHILWILILSILLIYRYLPYSSISSFCFSAILWMIPVHIGGIIIAPRWEKDMVKKASNVVGLIGLLLTFFISTITWEPFQVILQNVRVEWVNQIFALLFISAQK